MDEVFPWLAARLSSDNPLEKYGVAALVVFGGLALASQMGVPFAGLLALVAGFAVIMYRYGRG